MLLLVMSLQNQHLCSYYQNHGHMLLTPWPYQLNALDAYSPEILQMEGQDIRFCFLFEDLLQQKLGG